MLWPHDGAATAWPYGTSGDEQVAVDGVIIPTPPQTARAILER